MYLLSHRLKKMAAWVCPDEQLVWDVADANDVKQNNIESWSDEPSGGPHGK